jgi:hypothetical protein
MSGHHKFEELRQELRARKQAEMESKPPPWFGYQQVEEAPYPMTAEEHYRWPREPGWKYELHAGMCVRQWRGPNGYCGGYGILWAYQPATRIYRIIVPELPGCEMERPYTSDDDVNNWNRNLEAGGEMVYRWMAAAWDAVTTPDSVGTPVVPLPYILEEPSDDPPLDHLKRYGVIPLETPADYDLAVAVLFAVLDRTSGEEAHPLIPLLMALSDEVEAYEDAHFPFDETPKAKETLNRESRRHQAARAARARERAMERLTQLSEDLGLYDLPPNNT